MAERKQEVPERRHDQADREVFAISTYKLGLQSDKVEAKFSKGPQPLSNVNMYLNINYGGERRGWRSGSTGNGLGP